ncbi:MAG: hypothetical protein EXX96DRAFT_652972 [Benjaminiella poitrasii]|nr:MAG: hypothetical protein EXX96DRAFT_652972 [Benjaminiella poitrasii]
MAQKDDNNLNAWPNSYKKRHSVNVMEFYHKILWDSQHQQQQSESDTLKDENRRVRFSAEPPEIYEYEADDTGYPLPDYTCIFPRRSESSFYYCLLDENKSMIHLKQLQKHIVTIEDNIHFDGDKSQDYQYNRLKKSRSLTDFRPIPNHQFRGSRTELDCSTKVFDLVQLATATPLIRSDLSERNSKISLPSTFENVKEEIIHIDEPPPSYVEYKDTASSSKEGNVRTITQPENNNLIAKNIHLFRSCKNKIQMSCIIHETLQGVAYNAVTHGNILQLPSIQGPSYWSGRWFVGTSLCHAFSPISSYSACRSEALPLRYLISDVVCWSTYLGRFIASRISAFLLSLDSVCRNSFQVNPFNDITLSNLRRYWSYKVLVSNDPLWKRHYQGVIPSPYSVSYGYYLS